MSWQIFIHDLNLILGLHLSLLPPHPTLPLQVKVSTGSVGLGLCMYTGPDVLFLFSFFLTDVVGFATTQNIFGYYAVECNTLVYVIHLRDVK